MPGLGCEVKDPDLASPAPCLVQIRLNLGRSYHSQPPSPLNPLLPLILLWKQLPLSGRLTMDLGLIRTWHLGESQKLGEV